MLVYKDQLGLKVLRVQVDHKVLRDWQDQLDHLVRLDSRAPKAYLEIQETKVHLVKTDLLDQRDLLEHEEILVHPVHLVP